MLDERPERVAPGKQPAPLLVKNVAKVCRATMAGFISGLMANILPSAAADAAPAPVDVEVPVEAPPAHAPAYVHGEIVWAYCRGFPWWPCQIRSARLLSKPLPGEEPQVRVRFLQSNENLDVTMDHVKKYAPNAAELGVVKKKMFKSAGPRAKFEAAVREAAEWHERGGPPPRAADAPAEVWSDDEAHDKDMAVAQSLVSLGNLHTERGDKAQEAGESAQAKASYAKARGFLEESKDCYVRGAGGQEMHPRVAWALEALGRLNEKEGNIDDALTCFEKATDIRTQLQKRDESIECFTKELADNQSKMADLRRQRGLRPDRV